MKRNRKILLKLIYIAMFSALSFIGTMIFIPFGASKIHLGNLVCILAGLLCGGLIGGLSGSIGMGLNDIVMGYGPETYLRTFILKFLMGFIVGLLFRVMLKKKANGFTFNLISSLALTGLSGYLLYLYLIDTPKITLWILVLSFALAILFLVVSFLSKNLDPTMNCLSFSLVVAIGVNVIGEFFIRMLINTIIGMTSEEALATSLSKLPASLVTSLLTILLVLPLFYPLYHATKKFNAFNDLENVLSLSQMKGKEQHETKQNTTRNDETESGLRK